MKCRLIPGVAQVKLVKEGKPYVMFGDGRLAACKPISEADLASFMADCVMDPRQGRRRPAHWRCGSCPRDRLAWPNLASMHALLSREEQNAGAELSCTSACTEARSIQNVGRPGTGAVWLARGLLGEVGDGCGRGQGRARRGRRASRGSTCLSWRSASPASSRSPCRSWTVSSASSTFSPRSSPAWR